MCLALTQNILSFQTYFFTTGGGVGLSAIYCACSADSFNTSLIYGKGNNINLAGDFFAYISGNAGYSNDNKYHYNVYSISISAGFDQIPNGVDASYILFLNRFSVKL